MPAGRPRLHPNRAEKQFAYRARHAAQRDDDKQLAQRAKELLEVAASRGIVRNSSEPVSAQMDALLEWIRSN